MPDYHFGQNLRSMRRARNVTQTELASAVTATGLGRWGQQDVSGYEDMDVCANGKFAEAAARVLGIPTFALHAPLQDAGAFGRQLRKVRRIMETACAT